VVSPPGKVVPLRRVVGSPTEMSDEALLAACAVGETAALGGLFDRHHAAAARVLSRIVGSTSSEIDDLVQITFLEVWRSSARFRGDAAVRSWILGVAANVARHHVRGEIRRRSVLAGLADRPERATARPDDQVARAELLQLLGEALTELSHDLRIAFVLCDLEDVPGVDAARALGVRVGTMWRRVHAARKALRRALEGSPS
jgi:RNA polymerase sigma-70 factor (ECF subfamily)